MPNQNQDNDRPKTTKRSKKRVWLAAIVSVIAVICCLLLWDLLKSKSVDEQLAAIEAARAIPDSENAAVVYNQLLQNPYPAGVKEDQYTIDKLIEATRLENCRFPIIPSAESAPPQRVRLSAMKRWTLLLARTAENDLADGRIDEAIRKWRCILHMGNHLRQQPLFSDYLVACAVEYMPLHDAAIFVVEGNAAKAHLNQIDAMPLHTADRWPAAHEEIAPVSELVDRKWKEEWGLLDRIKYEFDSGLLGRTNEHDTEAMGEISRRLLTTSRGIHVLIALRRYRNKHGRWPQRLDEIEPHVSVEALIDPFNNGPFVYRLTEDSFTLYSKGRNRIDEHGKYRDPFDDWPIWPPRSRKTKTKEENADPNQPDTSTEPVQ